MRNFTKCINCGGQLSFNPSKSMLFCQHCDSSFAMPQAKRDVKLLRKYSIDFLPERDEGQQNLFVCNTCNSVHMVGGEKVSKRCPSCGDTNIVRFQSKTGLPDGIVPFKLDKNEAVKIFQKWLKKRKFAPDDLYNLAKNGKISGVYVPIFNIHGSCETSYGATVKKVHTDSDSGTIFSTVHTIKDTMAKTIEDEPLCANSVVDKSLVEKVAAIKRNEIVPFSQEYLMGFYGAETNLDIHSLLKNLQTEIKNKQEHDIRVNLNNKYDEIVHLSCNTKVSNITFNYTFVPIYMNHYTYNNKKYHCYISGTTGKVAGSAPKSVGKILTLIGSIALGIAAIVFAILKIV